MEFFFWLAIATIISEWWFIAALETAGDAALERVCDITYFMVWFAYAFALTLRITVLFFSAWLNHPLV